MDNRIMRTVLFAAFAFLHMSAFGAGTARFGTLRNSDWVVTNAWQVVSNKTHDLILEIGHGDSLPPDWQNVSNAAMNAVQSLQPAYDYADNAITSFSSTGIVFRSFSYGTSNYWTDATGCVWEARMIVSMQDVWLDTATGNLFAWNGGGNTYMWTCSVIYEGFPDQAYVQWLPPDSGLIDYDWGEWFGEKTTTSWVFAARLDRDGPANMFQCSADGLDDSIFGGRLVRVSPLVTNLVGRVALTNDLPDVAHSLTNTYDFATNVGLYTAVRDLILALGGSVTNFPTIGGGN